MRLEILFGARLRLILINIDVLSVYLTDLKRFIIELVSFGGLDFFVLELLGPHSLGRSFSLT